MKTWILILIAFIVGAIVGGIIIESSYNDMLEDCWDYNSGCEKSYNDMVEHYNKQTVAYDEFTKWCFDLLDDWKELSDDLIDYPSDYNYNDYSYPICSYNAYDCYDFQTWSEAQTVMEYCTATTKNNDIHYLDGDDDGVACENLK